jgi:DNA-binding transcriptional MerR regulator
MKMREKEIRRQLAVFPMGSVMKLTDLTARQIRYYEDQGLINPERSDGNRRLYSLIDIDSLLEIRDYLAEGLNIAGIKHVFEMRAAEAEIKRQEEEAQINRNLTDADVRRILRDELLQQKYNNPNARFTNNRPKM